MYEFEIRNTLTNEIDYIYGYNTKDAFRRRDYNPAEWAVLSRDYID